MPGNKNITPDMLFRRLTVGGGNSGVDAEVLMPFGQQENGSMTSQYAVGSDEVATEENCRGQYQTNRNQRFTWTFLLKRLDSKRIERVIW